MDHKSSKPRLKAGSRPMMTGIPNPTCPILLEAKIVYEKANDLSKAIRKLRRSTQRCHTCPERAECPTVTILTDALHTAIEQVLMEWGWDEA
jgi:hypothetical protein